MAHHIKQLRLDILPSRKQRRLYTKQLSGIFFENLGIIDKIVIDNGPTEFAHLDIPDPAFVLEGASDDRFLNVFNKIRDNNANNSLARPKKLYLSRSKLETGTTVGEIFLENAFVRAGYESIYMESLTPQQQIQLFSIATHVAGIQGSAFHSLLFAPSETKSIVIVREPTTLPTFETIDKLRKIDSLYVGDVMEVFEDFPQVHAQGPYIINFEKLLSQNTQNELGEILSDVLVPERGELLEHFEREWAYCHIRNGKIAGDLATSRDAAMEVRTRFEKLTDRN